MPAGSQCEKRIKRSRANGCCTTTGCDAQLQNAVEPGERERRREQHEERGAGGEEGADLALLRLHHQAGVHRLVDLLEIRRIAGVEVLAARQVGDRAQRLLVQTHVHRPAVRSEEHTSELQSHVNLVCRLLLEKKKKKKQRLLHITKNIL